jgi:hypothetical protein
MTDAKRTCPSSIGKEGAMLLGVINESGKAEILEHPLTVTKSFLELANAGRSPEKRFRFANRCVESGCTQWTGSRCGVIDNIIQQINADVDKIPNCSIRSTCRWFDQAGYKACKSCTYVVTDCSSE